MTTNTEFTWDNNPTEHEEYRVYRSYSLFNEGSLPTPLATLPSSNNSYIDDTVALGDVCYYMFAVKQTNGDVFYSDIITINVDYNLFMAGSSSGGAAVHKVSADGYLSWQATESTTEMEIVFRNVDASADEIFCLTEERFELTEYEQYITVYDHQGNKLRETGKNRQFGVELNDPFFYRNGFFYTMYYGYPSGNDQIGYIENSANAPVSYVSNVTGMIGTYRFREFIPYKDNRMFISYFNTDDDSLHLAEMTGEGASAEVSHFATVLNSGANINVKACTTKSGLICFFFNDMIVAFDPATNTLISDRIGYGGYTIKPSSIYENKVYVMKGGDLIRVDVVDGTEESILSSSPFMIEFYVTKTEKLYTWGEFSIPNIIKIDPEATGDKIIWDQLKTDYSAGTMGVVHDYGKINQVDFNT